MKHIFLTGEIQIGKSTVINKTLSLLNIPFGGFRTRFGPDRTSPERCLYIHEASEAPCFNDRHVVARFQKSAPPVALAPRFDTLGVGYLRQARRSTKLIVMDECGSLERNALAFQAEILDTLEGGVPILGVIKLASAGWVDKLRVHKNVDLITVDVNNRDALPEYCRQRLRMYL